MVKSQQIVINFFPVGEIFVNDVLQKYFFIFSRKKIPMRRNKAEKLHQAILNDDAD
jgi:hypothetical protein